MELKKRNMKVTARRIILTALGAIISALGITIFLIPANLLSGGVSGIGLIFNALFSINVGLAVAIINIPIFIIAWRSINKGFTLYSLLGMLVYSVTLTFTSNIKFDTGISDAMLLCIIGGIVNGIGSGIVFRQKASCGGTDILSVLLNDRLPISVPMISFILCGLIVLADIFISTTQLAAYTLVSIYISSYVTNKVLNGLDSKKMLIITTDKPKELGHELNKATGRGATILYGEGSYSNEFTCSIYCIVPSSELSSIIDVAKDVDTTAFISVSDVSAVHGRGFRKPVF